MQKVYLLGNIKKSTRFTTHFYFKEDVNFGMLAFFKVRMRNEPL